MNAYLFLYGSLRGACNGIRSQWLAGFSKNLGRAYCTGTLYDLGDYCGLLLNPDGQRITGELIELQHPEKHFALLDKYEGMEEAYAQYLRQEVTFELEDGSEVRAWAYLMHRRLTNTFPVIAEADYMEFLGQNKRHQEFVYGQKKSVRHFIQGPDTLEI